MTPLNSQPFDLQDFVFPEDIEVDQQYLFYLHGKIIEDQGIDAVSPEFGAFQYKEILHTLRGHGFIVISEPRSKDADVWLYAEKVSGQVQALADAGVPPEHITVVGASKGAYIAILVSHLVKNSEVKFVFMAICHPEVMTDLLANQINVYGSVLSIYDSIDNYAGSCQELFSYSDGNGLSSYEEIVLEIGTGHGILYQPLPEWVNPVVDWARAP